MSNVNDLIFSSCQITNHNSFETCESREPEANLILRFHVTHVYISLHLKPNQQITNYQLVVTAIQGLIDAADEQLNVRDVRGARIETETETETEIETEIETDSNKVSAVKWARSNR